ncbi:MAG: hypothetical protein AB1646_25840, partial [Thermodesulfobacteriota bacterium]
MKIRVNPSPRGTLRCNTRSTVRVGGRKRQGFGPEVLGGNASILNKLWGFLDGTPRKFVYHLEPGKLTRSRSVVKLESAYEGKHSVIRGELSMWGRLSSLPFQNRQA